MWIFSCHMQCESPLASSEYHCTPSRSRQDEQQYLEKPNYVGCATSRWSRRSTMYADALSTIKVRDAWATFSVSFGDRETVY
eukprot:c12955_g1_i1 orf=97-342(-)